MENNLFHFNNQCARLSEKTMEYNSNVQKMSTFFKNSQVPVMHNANLFMETNNNGLLPEDSYPSITLKNGLTFNQINRNQSNNLQKQVYHPFGGMQQLTPNSNINTNYLFSSPFSMPLVDSNYSKDNSYTHYSPLPTTYFSPQVVSAGNTNNIGYPHMHGNRGFMYQHYANGYSQPNQKSSHTSIGYFPLTPQQNTRVLPNSLDVNSSTTGSPFSSPAPSKIGAYTMQERKEKIRYYKQKQTKWRKEHPIKRCFDGRKLVAESKPRIKGKFVKVNPHEKADMKNQGEETKNDQVN